MISPGRVYAKYYVDGLLEYKKGKLPNPRHIAKVCYVLLLSYNAALVRAKWGWYDQVVVYWAGRELWLVESGSRDHDARLWLVDMYGAGHAGRCAALLHACCVLQTGAGGLCPA